MSAERRVGELMDAKKQAGPSSQARRFDLVSGVSGGPEFRSLAEVSIDKDLAKRARNLAAVSADR